MSQDIYVRYLNTQGVAFAWIGAWLGPAFLYVGIEDLGGYEFWLGLFFVGIVILYFKDGIKAYKKRQYSNAIAYAAVPAILLAILLIWFVLGATGNLPYA